MNGNARVLLTIPGVFAQSDGRVYGYVFSRLNRTNVEFKTKEK